MQSSRRRASGAAAMVLLAVLLPAARPFADELPPLDPVVRDVVRMLEQGVEPSLVLQWLETSRRRPGPLGPDDLIALTEARAPEELTRRLLDLAGKPPPVEAEPATCCPLDVAITYRAAEAMEGEGEAPGMDLAVYLDGRPLARVESMPHLRLGGSGGPFERRLHLDPGRHVLRLLRERHTLRKSGWLHDSRVSPDAITFEIAPGAAYELELRWTETPFSTGGPLDWSLSRNGEKVAGQRNVGVDKDDWPPLCEDTAADGCVRWDELWPADAEIPSRAEVRAQMEAAGYEPAGD